MSKQNIHFLYDPKKEPDAAFAQSLIDDLEQTEAGDASVIVTVGGDGKLLEGLRRYPARHICGVVPPTSNSVGFWANRGVENANDLLKALIETPRYPIKRLRADICFADGSKTTRYAYNEFAIQSVDKPLPEELREAFGLSEIDVSVQSALLELSVSFNGSVLQPEPAMGSGIILSSAFGSTAMNRNYGGSTVDIRKEAIIMTRMGAATPFSTVNEGHAEFDIQVKSQEKRPVLMTFDSFGVKANEKGSPIADIKVSIDHSTITQLVVTGNPGTRAYAAMMPG